jgi:hypothetical protein
MKRKIIIGLFFNSLLLACGQSKHSENVNRKDSINQLVDSINVAKVDEDLIEIKQIAIDTFSTFPSEIDGCSCYFSNDKNELKSGRYIYADDYGPNAFISIGGHFIKFSLLKSDTLIGGYSIQIFNNEKYEMTVKKKQVGQLDETWQQQGTLTIKLGEKVIYKKDFYGECGC